MELFNRQKLELYTPTIAPVLPMILEHWNSFSAVKRFSKEAKLAYIKLNTQPPCPPRGAASPLP